MNVPYITHEATMARMERQNKRMFIALLVSAGTCFATTIGLSVAAFKKRKG